MAATTRPKISGPIVWTATFVAIGIMCAYRVGEMPLISGLGIGSCTALTLAEWLVFGYRNIIADYAEICDGYHRLIRQEMFK